MPIHALRPGPVRADLLDGRRYAANTVSLIIAGKLTRAAALHLEKIVEVDGTRIKVEIWDTGTPPWPAPAEC